MIHILTESINATPHILSVRYFDSDRPRLRPHPLRVHGHTVGDAPRHRCINPQRRGFDHVKSLAVHASISDTLRMMRLGGVTFGLAQAKPEGGIVNWHGSV